MSVNNNGNGKPPEQPHRPFGRVAALNVSAKPTEQTFHPVRQMSTQRDVQTFPSFREPNEQRDGFAKPQANAQRVGYGRSYEQTFPPLGQVKAGIDGNFAAPGQPNFLYNQANAPRVGYGRSSEQTFPPLGQVKAGIDGNFAAPGQPNFHYNDPNAQRDGFARPQAKAPSVGYERPSEQTFPPLGQVKAGIDGNFAAPVQPNFLYNEPNAQRDGFARPQANAPRVGYERSSEQTFHPLGQVKAGIDGNFAAPGQPNFHYNDPNAQRDGFARPQANAPSVGYERPSEQTFPPLGQVKAGIDGNFAAPGQPNFHYNDPNAQRDGFARPQANAPSVGYERPSEQTFPPLGQVKAGIDGNFAAPGQPNFLYNPVGAHLYGNAGQFGQPFLPFNLMNAQLPGNTGFSGFLPYAPMSAQLGGNPVPSGQPILPYTPMSPQLNANTGAFGPPFFPNAPMSPQLNANTGAFGPPFFPNAEMTAQEIVPFARPDPSYGYLLTERDILAYQIHVLHQKCTIMEQKDKNLPQEIYQLEKKRAELEFENAELQKECSKFEYEAKKTDNAYKLLKMEFECLKGKKRRNNVGKVEYLKDKNQTEDNHEENTRSTESPKKEDDKIMAINLYKPMLEKKNPLILMLENLMEFNLWQRKRSQSHINLLEQRLREKSVLNAKEHSLKLLLDELKKHKQMIEYQENFLQHRASEIHDQALTNEDLCWKIMHVEMEIRQKDEIIRDNEKTIQMLQDQIKQLNIQAEPSSIQLIEKEGAVGGVPASPSEEGAVGGEEANAVLEYDIVSLAHALLQLNATEAPDETKNQNE